MKKLFFLLLNIILSCKIFGQQGPVYSLYFQDPYYLNPAAAGSKGLTVFNITAKEFWLGFPENTPGTQSLVFHTRLNKININLGRDKKRNFAGNKRQEGRIGIGAMLYNDVNGPIRKTGFLTSYSYFVRLRSSVMSFGLSSNSYQVFTDREKLFLKNQNDPYLTQGEYFYVTDANVGFYLNSKDYFMSFSANNLMESKVKIKDNKYVTYIDTREYLFLVGYNFKFNNMLFFEPSFFFQTNEEFKTRMDLNFKWTYNKKLFTGFGISSHSALNLFLGVVSEQFDFGYSFQLPDKDILQYSLGSHEVVFSLKFGHNRFNRYQRFYR